MVGASFEVTFNDSEVLGAFRRLEEAAVNPERLLRVIGTGLVASTERRFRSNEAPSGAAWAALNPAYAEIRRSGPILVQSGALSRSITFRTGVGAVTIGSPLVYAAVHQFGARIEPKTARALRFHLGDGMGGLKRVDARSVLIPARPYLGISADDRATIVEDSLAFLGRALGAP